MQSPIYVKTQSTGSTPSPQDHKLNTTGKSPNSYQNDACIAKVDRKLYLIALPHQTNNSEHPPLQSPHTRVCGKRGVYDKFNNTLNTKAKLTTYMINHINVPTKPYTIKSNLLYTHSSTYKHKSNTIKVLGRMTIKNQKTNLLTTLEHKHKPIKPNSYKNVTNSINPFTYGKKIKTHTNTQYTLNINKPKPYIWKPSKTHIKHIKNHIERIYKKPNTLPCPKTHKYASTNFKIKINKLDHTNMDTHKENTKTQEQGPNTKNNDKDLSKHPYIYIKKNQ